MATALPRTLAQPAQRALSEAGITSVEDLARFTEAQIKELHGIGPNALVKLKEAMGASGVQFKERSETCCQRRAPHEYFRYGT